MGRVRVAGFSLSLDGFGAGPEQSLQDPLGKRGTELHRWFVGTKTFKAMFGEGGGSDGVGDGGSVNGRSKRLGGAAAAIVPPFVADMAVCFCRRLPISSS